MEMLKVISRDEWLVARKALPVEQATRLRDAVNAERLALPWVAVERGCASGRRRGRRALAYLFDGRSLLAA